MEKHRHDWRYTPTICCATKCTCYKCWKSTKVEKIHGKVLSYGMEIRIDKNNEARPRRNKNGRKKYLGIG